MADANKLVIELVDAGGNAGTPGKPPASSPSSMQETPVETEVKNLDDVFRRAREAAGKGETPQPPAAALPKFAPADAGSDAVPAADRSKVSLQAQAAVVEMNVLTADLAKRVRDRLLTFDEALGELAKAARARGVQLTEALRAGGMPLNMTAADEFKNRFRDAVRDQGMSVPASKPEMIDPSELRPVAMPKPNRPVGKVVFDPRQEEDRQKRDAEQRDKLLLAGIAGQNILGGGGLGQKAAGAVQLAGTGFLGAGAKNFANSPAGAAVQVAGIAADVADGIIRGMGRAGRDAIQTAGGAAQDIARNNGLGAFTKGVDAAADVLGKIPLAGTAAAEGLKVFTTALRVGQETIGAFANRGREIAGFNPAIAQAAALADVKKIQMDIAEANRFSAQYVRLIEAESRIDAAWRRATDPIRLRIMEFLAEKVAPWLENTAARFDGMFKAAEVFQVFVQNIPKLLTGNVTGFQDAIKAEMDRVVKELTKNDAVGDVGMLAVQSWVNVLDGIPIGPDAPPNVDRNLKLPLMKGF